MDGAATALHGIAQPSMQRDHRLKQLQLRGCRAAPPLNTTDELLLIAFIR
jgi:hypothetical protein